jgi:diguanylate cyclase (GGDEF)-like protein
VLSRGRRSRHRNWLTALAGEGRTPDRPSPPDPPKFAVRHERSRRSVTSAESNDATRRPTAADRCAPSKDPLILSEVTDVRQPNFHDAWGVASNSGTGGSGTMQAHNATQSTMPGGVTFDVPLACAADTWAAAISELGHREVDAGAIRPGLAAIVQAMINGAGHPSAELASVANAAGAALVDANLTDPGVLSATIDVLGRSLASTMGTQGVNHHLPLMQALGGLAAGFTAALLEDALVDRRNSEAALASLKYQAVHDPLTGLPNRASFNERVNEIFRDAGPETRIELCFLDVDSFKAVNDGLGHDVGDELLIAVAERIAYVVDRTGHLVARLGGDEFVIVGSGDAVPGIYSVADQVQRALECPIIVGPHELRVSVSIGVAEHLVRETSCAELMRTADARMRTAKAIRKANAAQTPHPEGPRRGSATHLRTSRKLNEHGARRAILPAVVRQNEPNLRSRRLPNNASPFARRAPR